MENQKKLLYEESSPSPILKDFILRFYQVRGFTSSLVSYTESTLPNGYTSLVLHFEEKIKVSNVKYDGEKIPQFYIFGKYTQPIYVEHTFGNVDVFGVIFKPGAFRFLTREAQSIFTDTLVAVDHLDNKINEILEQMYEAKFHIEEKLLLKERRKLLESFFCKKLEFKRYKANIVDVALSKIYQNKGNIKVKELSKALNISQQHLKRLFRDQIGLTPKFYAKTVRFNNVIKELDKSPNIDLLQLATNYGYHDPSHLIKEFYLFTGNKPSIFLKEENTLAKFLINR